MTCLCYRNTSFYIEALGSFAYKFVNKDYKNKQESMYKAYLRILNGKITDKKGFLKGFKLSAVGNADAAYYMKQNLL